MRRHRKGLRLLSLLFVSALLASACSGSDDGDDADGGTAASGEGLPSDTLIDYATLSADNPNHIDPATADTRQGSQVTELLYDGLTEVNSDNEVVPAVAESWEANDDSTVFTFTLRDDVTFSDGEAVTPTTFLESWHRALNPELASTLSYHYLPIEGAGEYFEGEADTVTGLAADDEAGTFEVTLSSPLSDWPAIVSHTVFSPVPEAAWSAETADEINQWEQGIMVGNGPYAMSEEWAPSEYIKLTANEDYWGEPAQIPNIEFRISADVAASFNAFEGGEGDTGYIPPGQFAAATEAYNHSTDPSFGVYYFGVAWEDEFLGGNDNLAVRQAISLAIDRERINDQIYDGARVNATGVTPPGVPGFTEDLCGEFCTYDPDRAAQLVEEWGKAADMEPIQLQFNLGGGHEEVATIVQEGLEAAGLKVEQAPLEGETYFEEMKKEGGCHLCRAGWIWDYPSYYSISSMFSSASIDGDNLGRYNNPEFDAKAAEAAAESDEATRDALWVEAERILFADMAVIPVNWYTNQIVYSDRVEGLIANALQAVNYPEMSLTE